MKERIGDALRNAAMRFGAALDLWHKGDLHADSGPTGIDGNTGEVLYSGMSPDILADWLQAIDQCVDEDHERMVRDGLAAATEVRDREAFVAIRAAGQKRKVPA